MSKKITGLTELTVLEPTDLLATVDDVSGVPETKKMTAENVFNSLDNVHTEEIVLNRPLYESIYADIRYNRSIVSMRFDDAKRADYETVFPLLAERDLVGTFLVISDKVQTPLGTYATVAEVLEMQEAGMEIVIHTKTHGTNPVDHDDFIAETAGARDTLNTLGFHVDSGSGCGTWTGEYLFDDIDKRLSRAGRLVREEFAAFYSYVEWDDLYNYIHSLPHRDRFGWRGSCGEEKTLAQLQEQVDLTIRYGGGLHLYWHAENIGTVDHISVADFTSCLDYIQTKRDAGLIDDLTLTSQLFAQKSPTKVNQVHDPGFGLSVTGTWLGWEIAAGAPEVVAGGRSGNCASVDTDNYIRQCFITPNMRSMRLVAWAKSDDATDVTAKIRVKNIAGTAIDQSATAVVGAAWTEIVLNFGIHYETTAIEVILVRTDGDNDVLFDDISLYKI